MPAVSDSETAEDMRNEIVMSLEWDLSRYERQLVTCDKGERNATRQSLTAKMHLLQEQLYFWKNLFVTSKSGGLKQHFSVQEETGEED